MDDFVIWENEYNEGSCVIQNPEGFGEQHMLMEGVGLLNQWPDNVVCRMDTEYPKDIQLTDNVYGGNFVVVSGRLKAQIALLAGASEVEFLPVAILNHKGRVASKDYFILNPIGTIDCIDVKESGVVWNAINTSHISRVKKLVLRNEAVPTEVSVFRPTHLNRRILVRRSLAYRVSSDGFTGLSFQEPAKFRG